MKRLLEGEVKSLIVIVLVAPLFSCEAEDGVCVNDGVPGICHSADTVLQCSDRDREQENDQHWAYYFQISCSDMALQDIDAASD